MEGGEGLLLVVTLLLAALITPTQQEYVVSIPPEDVVVERGGEALFYCKITGDPEQNAIYWGRIHDLTGDKQLIYKTFPENVDFDEVKYNFTKTAPLTSYIAVNDVAWTDSGRYVCQPLANPEMETTAHLIVVEKPIITIPESPSEGSSALLVCEFTYAGSIKIEEDGLKPILTARIGNLELNFNLTETPEISNGNTNKMKFDFTPTMKLEYDGKNFTCTVNIATSPPYEISSSQTIFLNAPVYAVKVDQERDVYYLGEQINCTAEGYPPPEFTWIPEVSGFKDKVIGAVLTITPGMAGENRWRCSAKNVVNGIDYANSTVISFKVEELFTGESKSNDVAIAVGVVVPIIAILAIVLIIVIVCIKKKKSQTYNAKDPEKAGPQSPTSDTLLKQPPPAADNTAPEASHLLRKVGPPKGDPMGNNLEVNTHDHSLSFSGDHNNSGTEPRDQTTPSPVDEKPSPAPRHTGSNTVEPPTREAMSVSSAGSDREVAQLTQQPDDLVEQEGLQQAYNKPTPVSEHAGNTAV